MSRRFRRLILTSLICALAKLSLNRRALFAADCVFGSSGELIRCIMQPPTHLLKLTLASLLLCTTAPAQQTDVVNVRPRAVSSPAGVPQVRIAVDRNRVPVGDSITVTLSPASVITDPKYTITLDFGDRTRTNTRRTQNVHPYKDSGFFTVTVSVAATTNNDPPPPPDVSLVFNPAKPIVGRAVEFTAKLTFPDASIKYQFSFGDNSNPTRWLNSPQTSHVYSIAGAYFVFVDIGRMNNGITKRIGGCKTQRVDVTRPEFRDVSLNAQPVRTDEGGSVLFTAIVNSDDPNILYRFAFGDGSPPTVWQAAPRTKHRYAVAGNFAAYVEITSLINRKPSTTRASNIRQIQVSRSIPPTPTPTPTPLVTPTATPFVTPTPEVAESPTPDGTSSPGASETATPGSSGSSTPAVATPTASANGSTTETTRGLFGIPSLWWQYILIALIVLFAGYQAFRFLFVPRFTLQAHRDPGESQVDVASGPLSIDFQIDLDPNVGEGGYEINRTFRLH